MLTSLTCDYDYHYFLSPSFWLCCSCVEVGQMYSNHSEKKPPEVDDLACQIIQNPDTEFSWFTINEGFGKEPEHCTHEKWPSDAWSKVMSDCLRSTLLGSLWHVPCQMLKDPNFEPSTWCFATVCHWCHQPTGLASSNGNPMIIVRDFRENCELQLDPFR